MTRLPLRARRLAPLALASCFGLSVLPGCGGAEPPPAAPAAPVASASASAVASAAPAASSSDGPASAAAPRTPSAELRRYWTFGDHARFALYGDLAGFTHTELARAFLPAALLVAKSELTEAQAGCLRGAFEGLKEIAVGSGSGSGEPLILVRFDDQAVPSSCLASTGMGKVSIDGAKEAYKDKDAVVAYVPGILVIGSESMVKEALSQAPGAGLFPARFALAPDEYVTWFAQVDADVRAHGTLTASNERFKLSVHADMPEGFAKSGEAGFRNIQTTGSVPGLEGAEAALARRLLSHVELTRSGGHLDAAFDLHEPPADQARDLGALAQSSVDALRKYMADARTSEARGTVRVIASDYAVLWEQDDAKARAKRKLFSLPPVPKTVPRGSKYASQASDWKPWERIRFSMDEPQYYQYEVKAAPDGESATVIARGDLNGDGKTSTFRLGLRIDRAGGSRLTIAPSIEETDPQE